MTQLTNEQHTVLALLRRSLWKQPAEINAQINWAEVNTIAKEQGVVSFTYDGARGMDLDIPQEIMQSWKKTMLAGVLKNELLLSKQAEALDWLKAAGISAAVLKGTSVSRYYPDPALRILGDIDILVAPKDLERAQEILESHGYSLHENDPGYHLSFVGHGQYLELHYDVTRLPKSVGGRKMKEVTSQLMNKIDYGSVDSYTFPVLTESKQGLALLLHMIRHMFGSCIGLRQLCDWAVYLAQMDRKAFQEHTIPLLEHGGILWYAKVASRTCVQYLGLNEIGLEWCEDVAEEYCQAFIADVFRGGNMGAANQGNLGIRFTDNDAMGTSQSSLQALWSRLTPRVYKHFPFAENHRVLVPFLMVFLIIRHFVFSAVGLRPRDSVTRALRSAKRRRDLYDMLKLFETD